MEPFLEGKTIFITGATGFLAKILVEKILRIQPNVRKLFLLVRASDTKSAKKRFNDEVMQTELFSVLREKIGANNLNSLIKEKVFPIVGDISLEDFGIENSEMFKEIDIIINSAATTRFDERYDIAMNINVLGAFNVLKFAKKCSNVKILVHVSTAYVCGEGEGVIPEKSFVLGETLNKNTKLEIDVERKVIEEKLKELEDQNLTTKEVTIAMRDLGIQRANLHGWPNTYSFTKAMGEMLLGHYKEDLRLVIIRPTIITSTYKEPFPGWIEGVKTVDSFILAYGKGVMNFCFGDPNTILDMIPGDMVVNSILASIIAHIGNDQHYPSQELIYHISSSKINPIKSLDIQSFLFHYFTKNPWMNKDGKIIKVGKHTLFSSMDNFRKYISTYYWPLLKIVELANVLSWRRFDKTYKDLKRKIDMAIRLSELYKPYLLFHGSFDDANTEKLRMAMKEHKMDDVLNFDPSCINWEDYFMNTHLPGAVNHIFWGLYILINWLINSSSAYYIRMIFCLQ
ncbi:fatty acyl-CoA reductase 3-like isoform X2 [Solanum tuberosum]|uniref:fatty acyl-CoA reductase 3-like isoform X2 n=1 Tax=Solanum tuberosum TaxID=4113 RepID=UPI00073A424B|nr:PREDICTED: fatty acyl-CoA reductase 3-like isoform X2 [Solanum tuberosum]